MRRSICVLTTALLFGCAEAANPGPGSGGSGGSAGSGAGSASSSSGSASGGSGGAGSSSVVINEISAVGEDWIELANAGTAEADLGDIGLCDSDADGDCNKDEAVHFPAGTTLAPGAYVLIVGDKMGMGAGPFTDCLPNGGPSSCFYAPWKVSASNGEKVHLVDADDDDLSEVEYPKDAVPDGQTWGRLPDLTGSFAANGPTPGGPNHAP